MSVALEEYEVEATLVDGEPVPMVFAVRLEKPDGIMQVLAKVEAEAAEWYVKNKLEILRKLKKRIAKVQRDQKRSAYRKALRDQAERRALERQFAKINTKRRATKCSTRK